MLIRPLALLLVVLACVLMGWTQPLPTPTTAATAHTLVKPLYRSDRIKVIDMCKSSDGHSGILRRVDIGARRMPAEVSVLLVFCAMREIVIATRGAGALKLDKMRAFALSTHTPALSSLFPLLSLQLPSHTLSLRLLSLFPPRSQTYAPPPSLHGSTLVIHNNSDAFGQNIESEESGGSLDGVVGCWGDASRGLRRGRGDLCAFVG